MPANANILPTSQAGLMEAIDADVYVASTITTGWLAMKDYEAVVATIAAGTLGASATVDAKFEQATTSGGAGAKDISPAKAIPQMTQAGGDSDSQSQMNLFAEELDVDGGFDFIRLSVTIGVATSDLYADVRGHYPHYGRASDTDNASVISII